MNILEKLKEIFENKPTDMRNLALSNMEKKLDQSIMQYENFGLRVFHMMAIIVLAVAILITDFLAKEARDLFYLLFCEDHGWLLAVLFYALVNVLYLLAFIEIKATASKGMAIIYKMILYLCIWAVAGTFTYLNAKHFGGVYNEFFWTHLLVNGGIHSALLWYYENIFDIEDIDVYINYLLIKYNLKG